MAHPNKARGDKGERDAVAYLVDFCAGDRHLKANAWRMLGAGRHDDRGDLDVLDDTVIQVKVCKPHTLVPKMREAATGAVVQQSNALLPFAVGLTKYPNARPPRVRWIASCLEWPTLIEAKDFSAQVAKAIEWVRDDSGPARESRVAVVRRSDVVPMFIAPFEAWYAARLQALSAAEGP